MDSLPDNTIPWHLITAALQGNLTPEEDAAFQQWMTAGAQNRELFLKVKDMWDNDLDDFPAYQQADETVAWNALHGKLHEAVNGTGNKRGFLFRIVSIAALFVVVAGIIVWYVAANNGRNYTTGAGEQSVSLPDGTVIKLFSATSIEVPAAYNRLTRKVILKKGKAFFEVEHKEHMPFIVDMGTATVKDIGTSFSVQKTNDSINVWVATGKVEFSNEARNEVRLLSAGMRLKFFPGMDHSHQAIFVDSLASVKQNRLRFVNTPLPEVVRSFKEVYNEQIILIDASLAQKKFTGNLEGQSFAGAIDVLCKALNITFIRQNDTCYLKKE